jgi:ribosomal protein S12 methylthiotransferase accessory factor
LWGELGSILFFARRFPLGGTLTTRREFGNSPDWATEAASACGVTRLADITRLDRLDIPVFQAVRPWGRALSVHQGKGLRAADARIGALMEAIENHQGESFNGPRRFAAYNELRSAERAGRPGDFGDGPNLAPGDDESLVWTPAHRLLSDEILWVPFDSVSLDYTQRTAAPVDRTSNGMGAGRASGFAARAALMELIERDAVTEWSKRPLAVRTGDRLSIYTVPFAWFRQLSDRIEAAGLRLSIYRLPSLANFPAFICEIRDPPSAIPGRRSIGAACRLTAEAALISTVTEAAQARLTLIAGVRDDLEPSLWLRRLSDEVPLATPMPSHMQPIAWREACRGFASENASMEPKDIALALARVGFPDSALIDLSPPGLGVSVVKAFSPGLGAFGRRRRAAPIR